MTNAEKALLRQAASLWGRLGGSVSSSAKATAARENGKKGGRPSNRCRRCFYRDNCDAHIPASEKCPFIVDDGVQGAKSPRLKRAAEQSPRPRKGARP